MSAVLRSDTLRLVPLPKVTPTVAHRLMLAFDGSQARNLNYAKEPNTLARQLAYLEEVQALGDPFWMIETVADERLIGTIALREVDRRNRNARLGILIFQREDRGKGWGADAIRLVESHAFQSMRLHKVYVRILASNVESQHKWTKLGYVYEGIMREEYLVDPQAERYEDMHSYGKIAPSS